MAQSVKAIPEGYHSVTPSIVVKDAKKAIDFYKRAFGAVENYTMLTPDGTRVVHADITIGNSHVMMCDELPDMGAFSAETYKGSPVSLWIYTEDVDAMYARAVKAGGVSKVAPVDMFWGDRFGAVIDPSGLQWSIATRKEEPSREEMKKRSEKFFASMAKK